METFSLSSTEPIVITPPPAAAEERKRPGLAFLLSLLYPGLGHIYCGKVQHGLTTAMFFTGAAAVVVLVSPTESTLWWGVALRMAIVLYGFAFLDAFYAAREINAGIDQYMIGSNPRIAAMLNLLTAGFGYFYLGEQGKGLLWFFVSRALFATVGARNTTVALLVELACVVVAVDAYRIAQRDLRESNPELSTDSWAGSVGGLTPYVPIALGLLLVVNYFLLIFAGVSMPDYSNRDQVQIVPDPAGGNTIEHRLYGVKMAMPEGWKKMERGNEFVLGMSHQDFGCQVGLMMRGVIPIRGQQGLARKMEAEVRAENPTYQWLSEGPAYIGDKQAYVLNFQAKYKTIPVLEKIIFVQHGLTLYSIFEATSVGTADECGPLMDDIVKSVKLNF